MPMAYYVRNGTGEDKPPEIVIAWQVDTGNVRDLHDIAAWIQDDGLTQRAGHGDWLVKDVNPTNVTGIVDTPNKGVWTDERFASEYRPLDRPAVT